MKDNWISVEDRLPEGGVVIIMEDGWGMSMGYYHNDDGHWQYAHSDFREYGTCSPTHWMPLPDPPDLQSE